MKKIVIFIAAAFVATGMAGCRSPGETVHHSVHDRDSVTARVTVVHDTLHDTVRVSDRTFVFSKGDTIVAFRDRVVYKATARSHEGLRADTVRVVVRDTLETVSQPSLTWAQRHVKGLLRLIVALCCLLGICVVLIRRR